MRLSILPYNLVVLIEIVSFARLCIKIMLQGDRCMALSFPISPERLKISDLVVHRLQFENNYDVLLHGNVWSITQKQNSWLNGLPGGGVGAGNVVNASRHHCAHVPRLTCLYNYVFQGFTL